MSCGYLLSLGDRRVGGFGQSRYGPPDAAGAKQGSQADTYYRGLTERGDIASCVDVEPVASASQIDPAKADILRG